jgi:hypothetical protein
MSGDGLMLNDQRETLNECPRNGLVIYLAMGLRRGHSYRLRNRRIKLSSISRRQAVVNPFSFSLVA